MGKSNVKDGMKFCKGKEHWLEATPENFSKDRKGALGLFHICRDCQKEVSAAYNKKNADINSKKYKKYYDDNRNYHIERSARYHYAHQEEIKEKMREYHKTYDYYFLRKKYDSRTQARKRNATGDHTEKDLIEIYEKQEGKCAYCKIELNGRFDVDHVIPLSRGGSNNPSNIVAACVHCNRSKHAKLLHEWDSRPLL